MFARTCNKIKHDPLIIIHILRRSRKNIDNFSLNDSGYRHCCVIPGFLHIQVVASLGQHCCQTLGRKCIPGAFHGVVRHAFPRPAEIQQFSNTGVDHAVAHQDKAIFQFNLKTIFSDLLAFNLPDCIGNIHQFAVPDKNTSRIVIFHQIGFSVMKDLKNTEGGISHLTHLTDRQCSGYGFNPLFNRRTFLEHGPKNLRCQCCQDIGLHTTSHTICQNHHIRIFRLKDLYLVPAQLLMYLIQTFPACFNTYFHSIFLRRLSV